MKELVSLWEKTLNPFASAEGRSVQGEPWGLFWEGSICVAQGSASCKSLGHPWSLHMGSPRNPAESVESLLWPLRMTSHTLHESPRYLRGPCPPQSSVPIPRDARRQQRGKRGWAKRGDRRSWLSVFSYCWLKHSYAGFFITRLLRAFRCLCALWQGDFRLSCFPELFNSCLLLKRLYYLEPPPPRSFFLRDISQDYLLHMFLGIAFWRK